MNIGGYVWFDPFGSPNFYAPQRVKHIDAALSVSLSNRYLVRQITFKLLAAFN